MEARITGLSYAILASIYALQAIIGYLVEYRLSSVFNFRRLNLAVYYPSLQPPVMFIKVWYTVLCSKFVGRYGDIEENIDTTFRTQKKKSKGKNWKLKL